MPEWPEMEHYKRLLTNAVAGRTIEQVVVQREKSINTPVEQFIDSVRGRQVVQIDRQAKMLLFRLDSGHSLLLHLMLGGWMHYGDERDKPQRTVQITLSFGSRSLYLIGLRLGYLHLFEQAGLRERLSGLGPDPVYGLTDAGELAHALGGRQATLKAALVDQRLLAGIGNCYSDEICHAAGLLPGRPPHSLQSGEWERLLEATHDVLKRALGAGGYMEHPFSADDTVTGGYNDVLLVYDRSGERCRRCGATVERRDVASKKSFCCPGCQH